MENHTLHWLTEALINLPESFLSSCVPNLQLHRLTTNIDYLGAEFYTNSVAGVLFDCQTCEQFYDEHTNECKQETKIQNNRETKKISSSKQKESSNSNLQNVSVSTCYVKKICNLASFRCTVFYLTQITLQLTFPLYKLMQNARLSCSSAADHQKLK